MKPCPFKQIQTDPLTKSGKRWMGVDNIGYTLSQLSLWVSLGSNTRGQVQMADDSAQGAGHGVLGHLPPLPRRALSNSFIAMEQASRKREGLPLLTDADIEALKAGQPMSWENGDAASAPVTAVSPPTPAPPTTAAAPAAPVAAAAITAPAPSADISEQVAKWVAAGKKWSKSAIAAEQGRAQSQWFTGTQRCRNHCPARRTSHSCGDCSSGDCSDCSGRSGGGNCGLCSSTGGGNPNSCSSTGGNRNCFCGCLRSTQRRIDQICRYTGGGDFQSGGRREE